MPYALSNGRRGHGRARPARRAHNRPRARAHNPLLMLRGKQHGKIITKKEAQYVAKYAGKGPLPYRAITQAESDFIKKKRAERKKEAKKAKKATRKSSKKRASAKKGHKMTKKQKAARKRAATRNRNKALRARRSSRKYRRSLGKKFTVRRTKVRATVARVKRRGSKGKGRLVFLVKKGKLRRGSRSKLRRARVMFNARNPGGLVQTLKDVFSMDTVKVLGGGLVGFSLAAGAGEALARKLVKNPTESKGAYIAVGVGAGIAVAVVGGSLIGRYSPKVGQAFMWGSLLGTVIRALSAAFPGKTGLDMPATAADADALSMKLHALEGKKAAGSLLGGALDKAKQAAGARDWLPAEPMGARDVDGYAALGQNVQGWLDVNSGSTVHPALATAGGGQSW